MTTVADSKGSHAMKPKTLTEQLEDVHAIAGIAASRAEIALHAADRAEAASIRVEDKLKDLTRATPDAEGRPGALHWIGTELVAIRKDVSPVSRARVYATCVVLSALAGALATCLAR